MKGPFNFDVIVVGAGHAGIEACLATSRLGLKTALVTTNLKRIGYMSCNPSIGGLAKGHMVREIDVLGGVMGSVADSTTIQFKRLNQSRGPAVRGTRTQNDKELYSQTMREIVANQENLQSFEFEVKRLILDGNQCCGVVLSDGSEMRSKAVIVTTGTFMNGVMHMGLVQSPGGRVGDQASIGLSDQLAEFGFTVRRLKTGTPARLLAETIDWSKTTPQSGDDKYYPFSLNSPDSLMLPQVLCYLSRTTEKTHEIIRNSLHLSPMFCGVIEGTGPRYCPSIEDKITRFSERESHQTFLEPESLSTNLVYLQGISTSLPREVQDDFLKTIPGLENVKVARYGYAVEYDFVEPTQIFHRLETRQIASLFLAGQINGTSGYEEAAAQGLIAGVNAAHKILGREEFILKRSEAYMGVLIDDLVTKGTREPYRMFTSRAEHRMVLREDNTIDRLEQSARVLGLQNTEKLDLLAKVKDRRLEILKGLQETRITPTESIQEVLRTIPTAPLLKSVSLEELLRRPEVSFESLACLGMALEDSPSILESVEIEVKYRGYIIKQDLLIKQAEGMDSLKLPIDLDYSKIKGLSSEEIQKLQTVQPRTLGQAQRISGVNPSAIQAIMIYLKGRVSADPSPTDRRSKISNEFFNTTLENQRLV
ncbi:MAG: tRNA uridine-5-carboxymethylaminomethyl(34) synthesis enzyme MnmG [Pseudobdellovibrionaceae bacterium]